MKNISIILTIALAAILLTGPVMSAEPKAEPRIAQHEAIHWKTGNAPGIVIVDGVIRDWPPALGPKPAEAQIAAWVKEYEAAMAAKQQALAAKEAQRVQAMDANLPSWAAIEKDINNIATLAEAKAYLLKLSRIIYWLARDKAD